MSEDNNQKEECGVFQVHGWHLKKEVTIGQLCTLISLIVAGLWFAFTIDGRVANNTKAIDDKTATINSRIDYEVRLINEKNELQEKNMNDRFDRYQRTVSEALGEIKGGIQRLEDKLDKKADK